VRLRSRGCGIGRRGGDETRCLRDIATVASGKRRDLLTPLHGPEKGGPLRCFVCAGAWHAAHRRRRRVVIRAIKAFTDGGGSWEDIDKLKITAMGHGFGFGLDPLGYMAESATTADETILLTSEILADALRLVHPDVHPPERQELAKRVTQQLLALQPFVFPAEKPKPIVPRDDGASRVTPIWRGKNSPVVEPLRKYPCTECAARLATPSTIGGTGKSWRSSTPSARQSASRQCRHGESHARPAGKNFEASARTPSIAQPRVGSAPIERRSRSAPMKAAATSGLSRDTLARSRRDVDIREAPLGFKRGLLIEPQPFQE
jgi:hypothetical protein